MALMITVHVIESNFQEEVLEGRDILLNLEHVRLILQNETNSILFFQNEDCLKVEPRVELTHYAEAQARLRETKA